MAFEAKIREIGSAPLLELLNRYGGWPVLDANWRKPQNQTIEELMGTMRRDLNEHFMISLIVGPDDMNSSVNVLLVRLRIYCRISWHFSGMHFFNLSLYSWIS